MALEWVAGFGVFVPYRVAPVPAEPLQPTGVRGEAHAGGHTAAIQVWPPRAVASKPVVTARLARFVDLPERVQKGPLVVQ